MIIRHFPNLTSTDDFYHYFGGGNVIFRAKSRLVSYDDHAAPLSVKTVLSERETYVIEGAPKSVDPNSYLVVNEGQEYSSHIESEGETESFCLFFDGRWVRQTLASLRAPAEAALDAPDSEAAQPLAFFSHLYYRDELISPLLAALQQAAAAPAPPAMWVEERFHELLSLLVGRHLTTCRQIQALGFARRSTRLELYRRLHRAKDYAHARFDQPVTLNELSQVACLSTNHFLRTFKEVFRQTPHQYLIGLRLERAKSLLAQTMLPVTDISLAVGFESLSSFGRQFRRRIGVSPADYRRKR